MALWLTPTMRSRLLFVESALMLSKYGVARFVSDGRNQSTRTRLSSVARRPVSAANIDELALRSLPHFVKQAWETVEPGTPLKWNSHLDLICTALQKQIEGVSGYRKLCVPPGSMKSLLVSVFSPAWEWLHNPSRRKLFLSNDDDLASRDSRRMRELITGDWYTELAAVAASRKGYESWTLAHDQKEKVNYATTKAGFRMARSIGSKITGKRGDDIVIDDPMVRQLSRQHPRGSAKLIEDRANGPAVMPMPGGGNSEARTGGCGGG